MKSYTWVLLAAFFCLAPSADASEAVFHPALTKATSDLDRAKDAELYSALRRVWGTWDRADPVHVEEVLNSAAQNPRLSPGARAYAELLGAFGRVRRGDIKSARDRVKKLGYVDQWLILGPFDNDGKTGLETEFAVEAEFTQAILPSKAYTGKERPVRWRTVPTNSFPFGWLDTGSLMRPETKLCVFATTFVSSAAKQAKRRKISAWVGVGGAFQMFWNGQSVLSDKAYRGHDFDRFAVELELEPGPNNLTLKLCDDERAPLASLRLADAQGRPDPELTASSDFALSEAAAETAARLGKTKAKAVAQKARALEGPIQTFERLTSSKNAKPSDLEAYANYLVDTGGDDPTVHKARDLARRAVDAEATVPRLLLTARLAEDRNQQHEWLSRAEALVAKSGQENKDLLLARALHRRTSPNFREAIPYFDRVLELDPDETTAIRGRVELYNMAGLPRTALSAIERAVERNPHSVNLLNMYASQLRLLGRSTEAQEVEGRYSGLRFDDAGYLGSMIDLAVKRNDRVASERWIERLLAAHPDGLWALGTAARAYRSLGQPERAAATYRRALELAPEDVPTMRTLADLQGELGKRDEQLALLREVLRVRPQDREVREYVEHLEPEKPRPDEAYAWNESRFLKLRHAPAAGHNRRTLRDLTVSTVFANGLGSQFRQIVFQPLTDAAAASARQYAFAYEANSQIVQLRGARVYRADGRTDEAIEYGEGPADDPSIAMYTSARTFYVQFPRLEPGDVVELRYRIDDVTKRNDFGTYFGEVKYLQGMEPTQNAEYVLITPKDRTFYIDHNIAGLEQNVTVSGNQRIYKFAAAKIPGLNPEPAMPPLPEVLGFVHVSTYKNWKDLGRWYWGLVKDQFDLDAETRALAKKITQGKTSETDKVKAVYDWVIKNTRYVALEFGIYGYKPRRCVQTVARGWGDCKDKATVIVTLLNELGIKSSLVVLRTQLRGDLKSKIASFAPFDHAIAYIPSLDLYLDATAEHTGLYELPRLDIGALALHVNGGDAELKYVPIPKPEHNTMRRELHAQVAPSGEAKLEIDYTTTGYNAAQWRAQYHAEATRRERMNHALGTEFPGFELEEANQGIVTHDLDRIEDKVSVKVRGTAASFARREGKQLSMAVTNGFRLTPNYASLSQRKQDVRLLALANMEDTFVIKLPAGAKVISAPANAAADTPFGSYSVNVQTERDQVTVKSHLRVKVNRVTPAEYAAWKRFCEEADRALAPRLVIE